MRDDKLPKNYKSSLSYIRGRYGADSVEYREALLEHNKCFSGLPLHEGGTTTVPPSRRYMNGSKKPVLDTTRAVTTKPSNAKRPEKTPAKVTQKKQPTGPVEMNYGDLVNELASNETVKRKEAPPVVDSIKPLEGESTLDFIRRRNKLLGK